MKIHDEGVKIHVRGVKVDLERVEFLEGVNFLELNLTFDLQI